MTDRFSSRMIPLALFLLAFWLVPLRLYDGLNLIPGDAGDARLNNYFLENIYQYLIGRVPSLWHMEFLYPFPWVLGFSDNLFGSAPVYLAARLAGAEADTAFQLWFLFGYVANFAAGYLALRRLGGSRAAASVGALIFTFALPTTAHAFHAQLHYRFGVPLALVFFAEFLSRGRWSAFLVAFAFLVWQFYATIYIGFFILMMMGLMVAVRLLTLTISAARGGMRSRIATADARPRSWQRLIMRILRVAGFLLGFFVLFSLLILLFFPYMNAVVFYGGLRHWTDISPGLPRPLSYLFTDSSWLWSNLNFAGFADLPSRQEHQMFVGLVPLFLALTGLVVALRKGMAQAVVLMTGAMGFMVLITLQIGGQSLWYYFHRLPLASVIRAMTRIDQVLLFPLGALAMIAVDGLRHRIGTSRGIWLAGAVAVLGMAEMAMVTGTTSAKSDWRARIAAVEAKLPQVIPRGAVLFMSQPDDQPRYDELDAMWVALRLGIPTMNGYSGNLPPGHQWHFNADCAEMGRRILAYQAIFPPPAPKADYIQRASKVLAIGFEACDPAMFTTPPDISVAKTAYGPQDARHLSYRIAPIDAKSGKVLVTITNSADFPFSAWSAIGLPIRLSWQFRDAEGKPLASWDDRIGLMTDIPAGGEIGVSLPIDRPKGAASIEVTLMQGDQFWFLNAGVATVSAPLPPAP
jgi:hypothetical protein